MRPPAAALVLGAAVVAALAACGRSEGPPAQAEKVRRGRDVYTFEGCAACHGSERQGSAKAPSLEALRRHWSAGELTRYLRQPTEYPYDRRLRRLADRFPTEMAGMPAASPERLDDLVAFLLAP
jgi:mono/diheme cytochrome c family protein